MSTGPENEFDLEKLFLPAWAQEPPTAKQYSQYEGREERNFEQRSDRPGRTDQRRTRAPGSRRDEGRPRENRGRPPGGKSGRPGSIGRDRPGGEREPRDRREHREPLQPLPELQLSLVPDEKGVESLSRQIKMTGRAYPLFDIAQMILQKPERHVIVFSIE